MHLKIAILPGDYIGPEVMTAALPVLETVLKKHGHTFEHSTHAVGGAGIDTAGKALPDETLAACQSADAILFGSVGGPKWEKLPPAQQPERASLLPLRKHFKLFANVRPGFLPTTLLDASPIRAERIPNGIDMVCIRELTGGLYFGQKKTTPIENDDIESIDTMVYKKSEIVRITNIAIDTARARRKRLISVDKANVLECSVLWRKTVSEHVAKMAPDIQLSHLYVDNAAMQLVRDPSAFDVILTENMFGDILSDEMAVVCGSLGMLSSASIGDIQNRHGKPFGLYEPAGGSAPDIAGQNKANPCAQILSAALMLRHSFGLNAEADEIDTAVKQTIAAGTRTGDIAFGGAISTTTEMASAILSKL